MGALGKVRVEQMRSPQSGQFVANQFVIQTPDGLYFQSYQTVIAFLPIGGRTQLDHARWACSRTTSKYRNEFLGESTDETRQKIKDGEYDLVDLN